MKFKTILIDIDNTLLDFSASEKIAFIKLLQDLEIEYSDELKAHYKEVNHKLWSDYEKGLITSETIKEQRFAQSFESFKLKYTGLEMDAMYRSHLEENTVLVDGAIEMLESISTEHNLVIVTNGIASSQYKRLENARIKHYFDYIAVSSEIGYTKPHTAFFETVNNMYPKIEKDSTLILGDSLSADIRGGNNWGIKTCWFNPNGLDKDSGVHVDYEINNLKELITIVK